MVRIPTMEHAVPQNVTSFQFRLVGDMTLKQFGYLATGMVIAYLSYVVILPLSPFIAIPLIGLSASLGAAFAFLPIADRPLDHWVKAFFKAIYSPTQVTWKPQKASAVKFNVKDPAFGNRLEIYLSSLGFTPPSTPHEKQAEIKPEIKPEVNPEVKPAQLSRIQPTAPSAPAAPSPVQQPPQDSNRLEQMAKYIQQLESEISASRTKLQQYIPAPPQPQQPQVSQNSQPTAAPSAPLNNPQVKVVDVPKPFSAQVMLTSLPNVINGITTDTAGNYLEGVIVSIHDRNGLPVRALKTNKLGQFAGATPLTTGTYTVTFEKDSLEFETLQIELNGSILAPLNVRAKKGGI